ncbi:HutD/Ves family protein [Azospirillum rugosum]|uniref:Environmental stress-induced protein Ves n=1 Tax=Azospirillum rugosum TaxID=416170 RepID=A0ABS4SX97_9PROT|nr:HutD family protein [Azospirillum rugosum]MBP2297181.1 environmental stress-induced protein Ves [Azospirillum rugosum]MDQ0530607.1 environmental stress-induced protein Ves [Azospirillum rugosum]
MPITLLDPADYRRMPWKNGGGTTTEIALAPLPATLPGGAGRFLWRVSIADVAQAGPFSAFSGYERLIAVVEGAGMRLTVDGVPATVRHRAPAFRFSGDAVVDCALLDGPIRDFNLIVDRAQAEGRLDLVPAGGSVAVPEGGVALVHALDGGVTLHIADGRMADGEVRVPAGWTARLDAMACTVVPEPGAHAVVAVVTASQEAGGR